MHLQLWKALSDTFVVYPDDAAALRLATAATHRIPYGAAAPLCTVYLVTFARIEGLSRKATRHQLQRLVELGLAKIEGEDDNLLIDLSPLLAKAAELAALATQRRDKSLG
jgi:hypothetical protein